MQKFLGFEMRVNSGWECRIKREFLCRANIRVVEKFRDSINKTASNVHFNEAEADRELIFQKLYSLQLQSERFFGLLAWIPIRKNL